MKKLVYILIAISLFHYFAYGQWVQQNGGTTVTLYNLQFVNENTGWIIGTASKILKTTNSGSNWVTQISPLPPNRELNGLHMLNANTGYIAGWTSTFLKTTNGGDNWVELVIPQGQYNDIYFLDEQTGWACAFLGVIRKTTMGV